MLAHVNGTWTNLCCPMPCSFYNAYPYASTCITCSKVACFLASEQTSAVTSNVFNVIEAKQDPLGGGVVVVCIRAIA